MPWTLGRPPGVLDTADAERIVATLVDAVPPGSFLAITHPTLELGGEANARAMEFWNENAKPPITARSRAEFTQFFAGLELLDPGVVPCSRWRPDAADVGGAITDVPQFGAVGRKA